MKVKRFFKRFFQIVLILGLLTVSAILMWILNETKPVAEQKEVKEAKSLVEFVPVKLGSVTVDIPSTGVVQAKKRTQLAAELSGKVVSVSEKFITGGTFEKGEVILEMDTSTYQAAVAQAEATVVEAEVALTTEMARSKQAKRDWDRLGKGAASTLTLREPQIKNARARVTAANSALDKAKRDLERTVIKAPFNATVSRKGTEVGNFLAPGSPIGEFFQTAPLEIRISIPLDDIRFLNTSKAGDITGEMKLWTTLGGQTVEWKAEVDRTEGEVDQQSRSIYVISDILPGQKDKTLIRLQPGLFLNSSIEGKKVDKVATVPAAAFLDLNRVVIVNAKDELEFRDVDVMRREGNFAYVISGLKENERLCVTELSTMIEGTKVEARPVPLADKAKVNKDNR